MAHLRDIPQLRRFRGRSALLVVCRDDADGWEQHRAAVAARDAELLTESTAGPLSAALGRPAIAICDRYLDVTVSAEDLAPEAALSELSFLSCRCEECPQAMHEPGGEAWAAAAAPVAGSAVS
jgi:hypothetical protein